MPFSYRRVLRQELRIFNVVGKPILLYLRITPDAALPFNPAIDPFQKNEDPIELNNYTKRYIKARFVEKDTQIFDDNGRKKEVTGTITCPAIYRSLLAETEFVDPFLDGSRFVKVGAIVNEGRSMITQQIKSLYNADTSEVVT
jgi:hypothetical protein